MHAVANILSQIVTPLTWGLLFEYLYNNFKIFTLYSLCVNMYTHSLRERHTTSCCCELLYLLTKTDPTIDQTVEFPTIIIKTCSCKCFAGFHHVKLQSNDQLGSELLTFVLSYNNANSWIFDFPVRSETVLQIANKLLLELCFSCKQSCIRI